MMVANEEALLSAIDRIYEAIERPELWPKTIYAIGELIGGRRHFWGLDQGTPTMHLEPTRKANAYEVGCYGTFFLSRMDLQALDQYAQEFGELIIRFLKIVFFSILQSQDEVGAREAIGLKMVQRYVEAFEPAAGIAGSPKSKPVGRKLIAALLGRTGVPSVAIIYDPCSSSLRISNVLCGCRRSSGCATSIRTCCQDPWIIWLMESCS